MTFSIARKLRMSFLLIIALFIGAAVILYQQSGQVEQSARSLLHNDLPTVEVSRSLQQSAQSSLLTLRAYMLLDGAGEKAQALTQQLNGIFAQVDQQLEALKLHVSDAQYQQLKTVWLKLKASEQAIIAISHSEENLPAHALMQNEAAPIAEVALDQLQSLINEEVTNPDGGERKRLMKLYADSYTSLSNALGVLRDYLFDGAAERLDKYQDWMARHAQAVAEIQRKQSSLSSSDQGLWQLFEEMQQLYLPLAKQVISLRQSPEWNQANFMMAQQTAPAASELAEILDGVVSARQAQAQLNGRAVSDNVTQMMMTLITVVLVAAAFALLVATWLGRHIGSRLARVVKRADEISHGDFSGQPLSGEGRDEIAALVTTVNRMTASLSSLVTGVSEKAAVVDTGMDQLLINNSGTASESVKQAEKVSSMAAAIEEMSVTADETARHTQSAANDLQQAVSLLTDGEQALGQNQQTVTELNTLIGQASSMVENLSAESDRIERVTEVIENLAAQTNLLALNAAIEAARAGEQGRGFAVVADEVRLLAQRTTDSTTEINAIVQAIQGSTRQVVSVIDHSQTLVGTGTEHTAAAGETLQATIRSMDDVAEKVRNMAVATEQQSEVAASLAGLVHELSGSASDVSGHCDAARQRAEAIKAQVDDLNQAMQKFAV
ncbi:HAMP domain-containing methyl-accepting chemotaxis protein [Photobacterium atrarenae]|uniref:Methyl-accepting chemotaxis protein n=1 Tax=Photobacterium atrarenae TaxID=865757 RepID=A0ABY5GP96_9GAMM|nr:HAMP domain-containing methyl-accepting chemotaxis protein [Photobacterium atrarenae]UTV30566.1 methyl-accepting chemotaxis protein [Photobacterium atrarenae]